jgi:hypothetical protein
MKRTCNEMKRICNEYVKFIEYSFGFFLNSEGLWWLQRHEKTLIQYAIVIGVCELIDSEGSGYPFLQRS